MRTWILAVAGAAVVLSVPASAHQRQSGYMSFGYSQAYPLRHGPRYGVPYHRSFGYAYPPSFYSLGWHVGPRYTVRRTYATAAERAALKLYVYPAAGQSEQQTADDRNACRAWSADETSYDPTRGAGTREQADEYRRAFTACMEGRDYVVR